MSDPTIEQIEADLRESQFKPWDVETFLANRHQAKIEALTQPDNRWARGWEVAKELGVLVFAFIGYLAVMALIGVWAATGEFPLGQ